MNPNRRKMLFRLKAYSAQVNNVAEVAKVVEQKHEKSVAPQSVEVLKEIEPQDVVDTPAHVSEAEVLKEEEKKEEVVLDKKRTSAKVKKPVESVE